jgi:hypothetical protein
VGKVIVAREEEKSLPAAPLGNAPQAQRQTLSEGE